MPHVERPCVKDCDERKISYSNLEKSSKQFWEIPPYTDEYILNVTIKGEAPGKYFSIVKMRIICGKTTDFLTIPIIYQVLRNGINLDRTFYDFGIIIEKKKTFLETVIYASNTISQSIEVFDIISLSDDGISVMIQNINKSSPIILKPFEEHKAIAKMIISTEFGDQIKNYRGKFLIITNETLMSEVLFPEAYFKISKYPNVFSNDFTFFINTTFAEKAFVIENNFTTSLEVSDILIEGESLDVSFPRFVTIHHKKKTKIGHIFFNMNEKSRRGIKMYLMHIFCNGMMINKPLVVYDKKLTCWSIGIRDCSRFQFIFGKVNMLESRTLSLNLTNNNLAEVIVYEIYSDSSAIKIFLEGLLDDKDRPILKDKPVTEKKILFAIAPGFTAHISLTLNPNEVGEFTTKFYVKSTSEVLEFPVSWECIYGQLKFIPASIRFDPSFPGIVQDKNISVISSFNTSFTIIAISSHDPRISTRVLQYEIKANSRTEVIQVRFDPRRSKKNYVDTNECLSLNSKSLTYDDLRVYSKNLMTWNSITEVYDTDIRTAIKIRTEAIQSIQLPVRAYLSKPSIAKEESVDIGLVEVGEKRSIFVTFFNPLDRPIEFKLFLASEGYGDLSFIKRNLEEKKHQ